MLVRVCGEQVKIREAEHVRRVVQGVIDRAVEDLETSARSSCEVGTSQTFPVSSGRRAAPEGSMMGSLRKHLFGHFGLHKIRELAVKPSGF
jgi:hypothetical protein